MLFEDTETSSSADDWKESFYRGGTAIIAAIYRGHFGTVRAAVSGILPGADGETVIHEVFLRLLSSESLRLAYRGGTFSSWLFTVAKNHAIDYARRRARETPMGLDLGPGASDTALEDRIAARSLVQTFRGALPPEWVAVFDARFVDQLDQRAAARSLGVPRTTLAYRELRIRRLLRTFLLSTEDV
jgi:RNA polymerase sigma-70 factor (ECF subfamily)